MSFRTRLFLGILLGAMLPLGALAYGVQHEMGRRLRAQYDQRVSAMADVIAGNLASNGAVVQSRLGAMIAELSRDNRFRRAALQEEGESRRYLLDYAGNAMKLAGLSLLQIQDSGGRILSSGHFRNEFDQSQPELPALLRSQHATLTLVRARTPEAPLLALVRVDSFRLGGRRFDVIGGVAAETLLQRRVPDPDISVALAYPGEPDSAADNRVLRKTELPYIDLLNERGARRIRPMWSSPNRWLPSRAFSEAWIAGSWPRWGSPPPSRWRSPPGSPPASAALSVSWPGRPPRSTLTGWTRTSRASVLMRSARSPGCWEP